MLRLRIQPVYDFEARGIDGGQQPGARAQAQVLGKVRQDQPALALGLQVRGQAVEETQQHAAVFVVQRMFDRRAGARG